jgi:hypothetical protein
MAPLLPHDDVAPDVIASHQCGTTPSNFATFPSGSATLILFFLVIFAAS